MLSANLYNFLYFKDTFVSFIIIVKQTLKTSDEFNNTNHRNNNNNNDLINNNNNNNLLGPAYRHRQDDTGQQA